MIKLDIQQGSLDWMLARSGKPTASEFDNLVTPLFKLRDGDTPKTYLYRKLAEKWLGGPLPQFNAWDMDQGRLLEEEARPFAELTLDRELERIGFITTDDGRIGCSPDGLFADGTGIEIKCPTSPIHVGYLLANKLPAEYAAQVHGSMYVTGAKTWTFLSYRRSFPPLILTVERDEAIQESIGAALELFCAKLDSAFQRLCDLNGGPPAHLNGSRATDGANTGENGRSPAFISDPNDIIL